MKLVRFVVLPSLCLASAVALAAEKAPPAVYRLAESTLAPIGTDATIVDAVRKQNAKGLSLADIKDMDKKWIATPGVAKFMKALMTSACGKRVTAIQKEHKFLSEIFVMDNQGANVCLTNKTSDYWQGDEAKFTEAYKGGAGAIYVSKVKFDESSQEYLVHVSVPVSDGEHVIGAITFGVNIDKL